MYQKLLIPIFLSVRDVKSPDFFFSIREIFFPGLDENSRPRDDITPVTAFNVKKGVSEKTMHESIACLQ